MVTPVALNSLFKRMLEAGGLPEIPLEALINKAASPFFIKNRAINFSQSPQ